MTTTIVWCLDNGNRRVLIVEYVALTQGYIVEMWEEQICGYALSPYITEIKRQIIIHPLQVVSAIKAAIRSNKVIEEIRGI